MAKFNSGKSVEAMIVLLIGTIALGMSAPMISKQLRNETLNSAQFQVINRKIESLEEQVRESKVPKVTVAFFCSAVTAQSASNPCPKGWTSIKDLGGHYLRIASFNSSGSLVDFVDSTMEQMVHKHKHVSPFMAYYGYSGLLGF